MSIEQLITEHLDIWTAADTEKKSGRGRSSGTAGNVYGVKKLRELILELAVRGKLVPQDANDEPANELLKRIAAEKVKLVAEGTIKKSKPLELIANDEKPFDLPVGWEWVRLFNIANVISGNAFKSEDFNNDSGTRVIKITNTGVNELIETPDFLPENFRTEYANFIVNEGDLLIALTRPYISNGLKISKCPLSYNESLLNQRVAAIKITHNVSQDYVFQNFKSPYVLKTYQERFGGSGLQPNLKISDVTDLLLPIAPIEEQHRIVTKVDELMALCDQLENQHNNAAEAHEKLVTHLLGTLTQSQNAEDFNTNWHRISEHFDTLFTTEASIDALKQTLLQLAVMGKLVPQDPNDEPASELLKRIQAEKAKLIAEGKIKKDKPLAEITDEEKPFELPVGWEWARLGDISQLKGGMAYQSSAFVETGKNQVIRMGNVRPWRLRIDEKAVFIDNSVADKTMEYSLNIDDIVITMTGTIGKRDYVYSARIHENDVQHKKLFLNQRLCSIRPYLIKPRYLDMAMKDDRLLDVIFSNATGTANQANISMSALNLWLIPIPPIKEQNFIVAKVNGLMEICDQLKASITSANQLQQKLADVVIEQAMS